MNKKLLEKFLSGQANKGERIQFLELKDAFVTTEGIDLTFYAGAAGTYNAATNEMKLDVAWSGYDGTATYKFFITPKE